MESLGLSHFDYLVIGIIALSGLIAFFRGFIQESLVCNLQNGYSILSKEEILKIISNQMDQKEKEKLSDYVIFNDEKNSIILQLTDILKQLEKVFYYEK